MRLEIEGRHPMALTITSNISVNKFFQYTQAYRVYLKIRTYL